jgi:hypothetical protein
VALRYPAQVKCFDRACGTPARYAAILLWALSFSGCERLRPGASEQAFERCAEASPSARRERVGALELVLEDRALEIKGLSWPFAVVAFSGPAPGGALKPEALASVRAASPALVFVLGGLGASEAEVTASLRALESLPMPVLLVQGGREHPAQLAAALESLESKHLFDVSGLQRIELGRDVLVPVPGSAHGRYSIDQGACGHALSEIKALAEALGPEPADERRHLIAWEAPAGGGPLSVARDAHGVDGGDPDLGELASRIGAEGGLFAWPHSRAGQPARQRGQRSASLGELAPDLQLVVPRLGGPAIERASGALLGSSFALLTFDSAGLRLDALVPAP